MGMFDDIKFEMDFPKCGAKVDGFQSKDGPCYLGVPGWVKILDWGYSAEVYGRGNDRAIIDRKTGEVIIRYKVREATGKEVLFIGEDRLKIQPQNNKGVIN